MKSAQKFLKHFDGEHIFATVNDKKSGAFYHYHSDFENALSKLKRDNRNGRGVFFCVNELHRDLDPKRKRTKKMFVRARAVWVEDDEVREEPRDDFELEPNLIVQSSPGKFHYYWLTSTTDRVNWEEQMNIMAEYYGCDPQARDLARVLRVPGFLHNKKDPVKVRFKCLRSEPYDFRAIQIAFSGRGKKKVQKISKEIEAQSIPENVEDVKSGHKHGPSLKIALSLANKGVPKEDIEAILSQFPEYNPGDHKRSIETAFEKIEEEKAEESSSIVVPDVKVEIEEDFTWPPGMFGDMCSQTYEMAHHPFRGVAIATSLGILSPLLGRIYNISGLGLNIYISLLMDTGMGKDMIRKIINRTFMQIDPLNGNKFVGPARFTGVPALWRTMIDSMSRVSVITEAGFMNGSDIGDKSGLSATLLSMYGSSGKYDVQNANEYSSKENSLPDLFSPNLTVIQESTPKSFIQALLKNDGDVNGDLARMWLLKIDQKKPYRNRNPRLKYEEEINKALTRHLKQAKKYLENKSPHNAVKDLKIPDWLDEESDRFVDLEEKEKSSGSSYRKVMLSRGWVKAVKISALISIFNQETEISKEVYDWVRAEIIERELVSIDRNIGKEDADDSNNVILEVSLKISLLLRNPKAGGLSPSLAKNNIFTPTSLNHLTKHSSLIKQLSRGRGYKAINNALIQVLDAMVDQGLLVKLNTVQIKRHKYCESARAKVGYQITEDFSAFMQ